MPDQHHSIDALLDEQRTFPPSEAFKSEALLRDVSLYDEADRDLQGFWARQAAELIDWNTEWHTICEWELPFSKWFVGGQLNVSHNCLDRHVLAGRGDKVAIHWEGEPGDTRTITYADLLAEVQQFANVLKGLGVERDVQFGGAHHGRGYGPALEPHHRTLHEVDALERQRGRRALGHHPRVERVDAGLR